MELSKQIQKYRKKQNLSQEDLAEKIHVTRHTISNWERNKNIPDLNSLILLSQIFNTSLDNLVKGDIKTMENQQDKKKLVSLVSKTLLIFREKLSYFIVFNKIICHLSLFIKIKYIIFI